MRHAWLVVLWTGCASARHPASPYSHLVDPPFLQAQPAPVQTTTLAVSAHGTAGIDGLGAHGEIGIEVPGVTITKPAFFGVSLEGANDLVFLLDRSGSMLGRKLDMAKDELVRTLDTLPDGTRFNVVFFGDRLTQLSGTTLTLDAAVRAQTKKFLRRVVVENATALVPALWLAEQLRAKRVVLLSDGLGTVMGGGDETLSAGRTMIRRGIRFDVVVLYKRDVPCHERTGTKLMNSYTAGSAEACRAEKAAATVRRLADESGGTFRDPLGSQDAP